MKYIFSLLFLGTLTTQLIAQCTVTASNGSYQVNMTVYPISLSNVITNGGGCTFTTEMFYNLQIVGSNTGSMYTFQGRVRCAGQNRTYDLPNGGGTGIVTSANGSAPHINGNCVAYNETFCDQTVIIIQGPNINYQEIICNYIAPLPVELVDFSGKQENNTILLSFITASEQNNDFFTIEKTTNGIEWEVVENIKGNGTTDKTSLYNAIDRNPSSGKIYYRLSQTDNDGTNKIYKIIAVNYNSLSSTNYSMFPNPSKDGKLNIIFESDSKKAVECNIYNLLGQRVANYTFLSSNQLEQIQLTENNSTYIVELIQENTVIARERIISN